MTPFFDPRLVRFGFFFLVLGGAVHAQSPSLPKAGGEVNIRIPTDIRTSEPGGTLRLGVTDAVLHHVAESLVAYRNDLSVGPGLATAWEISDDGKVYRFRLRRGVFFHNGAALTAGDVAWSWARLLGGDSRWRCKADFDGTGAAGIEIVRVEVTGTHEIEFELKRRSSLFLDRMADLGCFPAILHRSSLDSKGDWLRPVGTGPYVFDTWKKGRYIRLKRFSGYRGEGALDGYSGDRSPYIDVLNWIVVPEFATARAALLAGQLDVLTGLPEDELRELDKRPGVKVSSAQTSRIYALLIQTRDSLLRNDDLRRAIAHSIDYEDLTAVLSSGLTKHNPSLVPVVSRFHSPSHEIGHGFAPGIAQSLLKKTGYENQPIVIQTDRGSAQRFNLAILTHAMLRKSGFNVHLSVIDSATRIANYRSRNFQLMTFNFSPRANPTLIYGLVSGSIDDDPTHQWEDRQVRKWILHAARTSDVDRQRQLFENIHAKMIDDVPIIVFFNGVTVDALAENVRGYRSSVFGHPQLFGVWVSER